MCINSYSKGWTRIIKVQNGCKGASLFSEGA